MFQPAFAHPVEPCAARKQRQRLVEPQDEPLGELAHADGAPGERGQMRRRIRQIDGVSGEIDADADADRKFRPQTPALQQDAGELRPIDQQIVRPFEPRLDAEIGDRAPCRQPRDEAELRAIRDRAGIDQQRAAIKIAARRFPDAAVTPPARRLFLSDDPEPAGVAAERPATRLLAGAVERVMTLDAPTVEREPPDAQNRLLAAAAAAATRLAGASVPRITSSEAAPSTRRGALTPLSKAGAGSSKYMILTMRR